MRPSKRKPDQLRDIHFTLDYTKHAEGCVLVEFGDTKVICNCSISDELPRFLRDSDQGWLTAEYGMLPRSTHERMNREAARGKQGGRTVEIQRLIGRSLRAAVDLTILKGKTITIDCDVIQADGGTRTASITGACLALAHACNKLTKQGQLASNPFKHWIASVSVGLYQNTPVLDLDYAEDSNADTDMNVVMTDSGNFIEVQGTAENESFHRQQLDELLILAEKGIKELIEKQKSTLAV